MASTHLLMPSSLGLALGLSQEEVDAIVPISKMRTLVEERTGATDANRFYKLNPYVADIPEKYSKDINGRSASMISGL